MRYSHHYHDIKLTVAMIDIGDNHKQVVGLIDMKKFVAQLRRKHVAFNKVVRAPCKSAFYKLKKKLISKPF